MSEVTDEQRAAFGRDDSHERRAAFKREQVRIAGSLMCGHDTLLAAAADTICRSDPFRGPELHTDECVGCGQMRVDGHRAGCSWLSLADEFEGYL